MRKTPENQEVNEGQHELCHQVKLEERAPRELRERCRDESVPFEEYRTLRPLELARRLGVEDTACVDMLSAVANAQLRCDFALAAQAHVFQWLDAGKLTVEEACRLSGQLEQVPMPASALMFEESAKAEKAMNQNTAVGVEIEPLCSSASVSDSMAHEWKQLGLQTIGRGKVAALVLAGGQGTRLGLDGPKGMFDIGLPSGKVLFQLFCERLKRIGKLAMEVAKANGGASSASNAINPPLQKCPEYLSVPAQLDQQQALDEPQMAQAIKESASPRPMLLVMTSQLNHHQTKSAFASNAYFGLDEDDVVFFAQQAIPAFSPNGKLHMRSGHELAMAPDGNGGVYNALARSGALDLLLERGVTYLHVFSVDNALCRPCDPVFVGYCTQRNALVGSKVVWKSSPQEKVGVLAMRAGRPAVIEYSELDSTLATKTDAAGKLLFGAGNICNHLLHTSFLKTAALSGPNILPYHFARKKIDYADPDTGEPKHPDTVNAIKLESFIFDAFSLVEDHATLDVPREEDFAPVKNAQGRDSPQTARTALLQQGARWLRDAGARVLGDQGVEISPSLSYAGENLEQFAGSTLDASSAPVTLGEGFQK